jgi:pimeloyl-ACP methyl ester carboxylesterase
MALIHHVVTDAGKAGSGHPPIVFVHGFACSHSDYKAQVAHFSAKHKTVSVDLRGHGASPGTLDEISIERFGADVAEVMRALKLPPSILVGHSMGCRVVTEAALQAPGQTAAVILLDGSQFAAAMGPVMQERFAKPGGFTEMARGMFLDMFTAKSDKAVAEAVVERALKLPVEIGSKLLPDLLRYDVTRFEASLGGVKAPVMALQATFSNEKRERKTMTKGQMTPYLEMVRRVQPSSRIEIVPDTGHFPQLDEIAQTNALMQAFVATIKG